VSWVANIAAAAKSHGVGAASDKLTAFVRLFGKWNHKINLSAASSDAEVALHVVDSLALVPFLREVDSVIDVGSGGGFPGLIISISLDKTAVTCIEPIHKKTAFLSTAVRELGLSAKVHSRRVDPAVDSGFAAAVSRATFELGEWLTLGEQLVRPGGIVLGMEGRDQLALGPLDERHPYAHGDRTRALIVRRIPMTV